MADFDDPALRAAMRGFLDSVDALETAAESGGDPRELMDLSDAKSLARLTLRRRLEQLGWTPPGVSTSGAHRTGDADGGSRP